MGPKAGERRGAGAGLVAKVAACVFLSGAASLVLEVVWSRLLKLVFGSTTLAITTILVAYMLGLGLGGLLGGRLVRRLKNGVRAYGMMEVGVGLYALAVPWVLDLYPWLNREVLATLGFWPAAFLRFALVLVVLLLPTVLMGATLPVLVAALVRERGDLARRVGLFYGLNTLGAVVGVLLATFVLFRLVGVRGTNAIGAGLDLVVGLIAILSLAPALDRTEPAPEPAPDTGASRWSLPLVAYSAVGFTALVYEVAWTRVLALIFGSSIYAFATMLAGFLAGIALGSLIARRWFDRLKDPLGLYALGIALLGLAACGTALALGALPDLFLEAVARKGISGTRLVGLGLAASFLVMLPPTLILGALFPLAVRTVARGRAGQATADAYVANTIGSASGAFLAGFAFIPLLGTQRTIALAIAVNLGIAAVLLFAYRSGAPRRRTAGGVACLAFAAGLLFAPPGWREEDLAVGVYYRPEGLLDYGLPYLPLDGVPPDRMIFFKEGVNATVSVHEPADGLEGGGLSMRLNGKTDASLADMSTQVLSGHLPLLFGGPAETALVIGYASGVTTGSAWLHELQRIDVVEIEPAVIEAATFFDDHNHRPLAKEDVRLILDDGRTWLTTTQDTYDVIISEPSNPWITGCANLFTTEFFEVVHARLRPGGRLLQWIQLYGMEPDGLRSILAGLHSSFDHAYGFLAGAESTDLLLLATDEPLGLDDLPRWEELSPEVQDDLRRVSTHSTADLWSLMVLTPETLAELGREARYVNSDDSMYVELTAPWRLYDDTEETSELVWDLAQGVLPIIESGPDAPEAGLIGELAFSYRNRRHFVPLGASAVAASDRLGGHAYALAYGAEEALSANPPQVEAAEGMLDRALELDPTAFTPRLRRAWLRCQRMQYEEALADLAILLAERPDDLEARHLRVKALGTLGRMAEGRREIAELLDSPLVETEPHLWAEAAFFAAPLGDLEQAVREMERYLELVPTSPQEWTMLAQLEEARGDEARARRALDNAERARRNEALEIHRAARWQEGQGSLDEAIRTLELLIEFDPDYAPARQELERMRSTRGAP